MNSLLENYLDKFDAILISSRANIIYLTNYNGFSETERECFLLITKNNNYLITDKRYSDAVKKQVKNFEVIDTGAINFINNDYSNILENLKSKNIGIEEYDLKVLELKKLKKHIKKISSIDLREIRTIKESWEIENIKKACEITDKTFEFIIKKIKAGISEKQLALELELFIKNENADISFKPIVAYGTNSAIPHHNTTNTKLKKNQIVLMDFGVKINNYCSDMTRTIFFGSADAKFKQIYEVVLEAQLNAFQFLESFTNHKSINGSDIDKIARDYIIKKKYPPIPHSLGHGIGLEVHESPFISPKSKDKIKNNMVFSIEPGIYDIKFGGIRIEDLVLVKNGKAEFLSKSNRKLIEIPS